VNAYSREIGLASFSIAAIVVGHVHCAATGVAGPRPVDTTEMTPVDASCDGVAKSAGVDGVGERAVTFAHRFKGEN